MMTGAMKMTSVVTSMFVEPLVEHKRDYPMSSRSGLPKEMYNTDSQLSQSDI